MVKKKTFVIDNEGVKAIFDYIDEKTKDMATKTDISHLPTKEEFFSAVDKIMGELEAIREEHTVLAEHSTRHEDRIHKLEKIHPLYKHTSKKIVRN